MVYKIALIMEDEHIPNVCGNYNKRKTKNI